MKKRSFYGPLIPVLLFFITGISYACNLPPQANIDDCPKYTAVDYNTYFNGLSSDPDGYIVDWRWYFPPQAYDVEYHVHPWLVSCKFSPPGIYSVTLEVEDNLGATDTFDCTVYAVKVSITGHGAYIPVNTDDDNENSTQDRHEFEVVDNENDLYEITLSVEPNNLPGGRVLLQLGIYEGNISVWGEPNKATSVINPYHPNDPITEHEWNVSGPFSKTVWVEGYNVDNVYPYGSLGIFYLHPVQGYTVDADSAQFNPVQVCLFMDGVNEDNEEFPGNYLLYNKDDDDNDGVIDYADNDNPAEDDLIRIIPHWTEPAHCPYEPECSITGTVTFNVSPPDAKVKVWIPHPDYPTVNILKYSQLSFTPYPPVYETPDDLPKEFYVEGIQPSDGPRDVVFTLTHNGLGFVDTVKVTVVHVELFIDADYTQPLEDWPKEGDHLRSPKYMFGETDPIYIQVKNIGKDPDVAETFYEAVVAKSQSSDYIYTDLKETGADTQIFRNSIADRGELLYPFTNDIDDYPATMDPDKIKVMNEEVLYFYLAIPPNSVNYKWSEDVMIDRAEVAAVDGTPTLDAAEFHNDMLSNHDWFSNGLYDKNHAKHLGDDDMCVGLGNNADFMYIAGHCWSGDNPTRIYAVDNTYGLKSHYSSQNLQVADVDTWARELDWLLLACCSTCKIDYDTKTGPGTEWVGTMDDGGLTHGIMGYRYGAPGGTTPTTDVQLASEFVSALDNKTVKDSWIDTNFAHKWATSNHKYSPLYAVAIFRNENVSDQLGPICSQNITRDLSEENFTYYEIYWEPKEDPPYVNESSVKKDSWSYLP